MCPLVQLGLDCLKIELEVNNRHTVVANYLEVGTTSQQFTLKQLFPINKITTYCVARTKRAVKITVLCRRKLGP